MATGLSESLLDARGWGAPRRNTGRSGSSDALAETPFGGRMGCSSPVSYSSSFLGAAFGAELDADALLGLVRSAVLEFEVESARFRMGRSGSLLAGLESGGV